MTATVTRFKMTPGLRAKIDGLIRPILKEHGTAVECDESFDHRYSSKPKTDKTAGWGAYERHLLADGHVIFVSLDTMAATYSKKPARKDGAAYRKMVRRRAQAERDAEPKTLKAAAEGKVIRKRKAADAHVKAKKAKKASAKAEPEVETEATTDELLQLSDLHKPTGLKGDEVPVVKYDPKLPTVTQTARRKVANPLTDVKQEPVS